MISGAPFVIRHLPNGSRKIEIRLTSNDVEPIPYILKDIDKRLGALPKYMDLDAG